MKSKIKNYLKNLNPKVLKLKEIKDIKLKKLGLGESNLNYLVIINKKKFNFRINMDTKQPWKSKREYQALKLIENSKIAPKAFHFEKSKEYFGENFIILEYLEGEDLRKKKITNKLIINLAKTVTKLHNVKITKRMRKLRNEKNYKQFLIDELKKRLNYIKTKRKKYFLNPNIDKILSNKYNELKKLRFYSEVLGHGDICPQNVILHKNKLKLIDWEDLGTIDPALEIVRIFQDFELSEKQQQIFLKKYLSLRKELNLKKRIKDAWNVYFFEVFTWSILHILEIKEGDMHKEFIKKQDIKGHINYSKKIFRKAQKQKVFDPKLKWNKLEIFPKSVKNRNFS